jgi:predicted DNA-binding protein with PD1-like motif
VIVGESAYTRCVMGRLEAGEEVLAAVRELARAERIDAAFVRGHGTLAAVELARWEPGARVWAPAGGVTGPAELVTLQGSISLEEGVAAPWLWALVAPAAGAPLGGRLLSARVIHVELAVDVLDDGDLERRPDAATGLPLWRPPRRR